MSTENLNNDDWEEADDNRYNLRLFVVGTSPASVRAINNLKQVLEENLHGRYDLEIIDVHQQPNLAQEENLTALPVLVKNIPAPKRLLIGDMSDRKKVLRGLGLTY